MNKVTNIISDEMDNTDSSELFTQPSDHLNLLELDADMLRGVADMIAVQMSDPLAAIAAHANAGLQWLRHDPPRLERVQYSLERIAAATVVASDMLTSHRSNSTNLETRFAFYDVENSIVKSLECIRLSRPELIIECGIELPRSTVVFGQKRLLEHALVNLISVLLDQIKEPHPSRTISIVGRIQADNLLIAISDIGLSAMEYPRLELSEATQGRSSGFDVRFAIARTLVLLQHGTIETGAVADNEMTILLKLPTHRAPIGADGLRGKASESCHE